MSCNSCNDTPAPGKCCDPPPRPCPPPSAPKCSVPDTLRFGCPKLDCAPPPPKPACPPPPPKCVSLGPQPGQNMCGPCCPEPQPCCTPPKAPPMSVPQCHSPTGKDCCSTPPSCCYEPPPPKPPVGCCPNTSCAVAPLCMGGGCKKK